jgi:hypothetical protein
MGIVHGPLDNDQVQTQKIVIFTHITLDLPSLETKISHRKFLTIFLDIWTLSQAKLKFIIGRAKIPCQMFDMRAQPVLDVVVEPCETTY